MSYRSTKKGTVNVRKGKEDQYKLFMGIPCQRNYISVGERCLLYIAKMVGRGAWGTHHGLDKVVEAHVIQNSKDVITFELEDGSKKIFRKKSPHMFRCIKLQQGAEVKDEGLSI